MSLADQIDAWLRNKPGGRVRAGQDNLLVFIGHEADLTHQGVIDPEAIRRALYELAARKRISIEFRGPDSPIIVSIVALDASGDDQAASELRRELADLHHKVVGLQARLQAAEPDIHAARELAEEAETARLAAESALQLAQGQLASLRAGDHSRPKDLRRIATLDARVARLEEALAVAKTALALTQASEARGQRRIGALEEELGALTAIRAAEVAEAQRAEKEAEHIRDIFPCGCIAALVDRTGCTIGGKHPYYPVILGRRVPRSDAKRIIDELTVAIMQRFGFDAAIVMRNSDD